jgi:hypothetical protein
LNPLIKKRERTVSPKRPDALEITSETLQSELTAIKDRLTAIETIEGISNATVVKKYVEDHLTTDKARDVMAECEEPKTRAALQQKFSFGSVQALNYHLNPLLDAALLRKHAQEDGTTVIEWTNLFKSLPKTSIRAILLTTKGSDNGGKETGRKAKKATRAR